MYPSIQSRNLRYWSRPEEGYQHIEITEEQAYPIKTFKDKMEDYKVIFSSVTKQHELRKLENNVDENPICITQLQEKRKDPYFDVIFSVDKKKDLCYISTIEGLSNVKFDASIMFSITKKDDPHFLIESVDYQVGDKLELEIKLDELHSISQTANRCVVCMRRYNEDCRAGYYIFKLR